MQKINLLLGLSLTLYEHFLYWIHHTQLKSRSELSVQRTIVPSRFLAPLLAQNVLNVLLIVLHVSSWSELQADQL